MQTYFKGVGMGVGAPVNPTGTAQHSSPMPLPVQMQPAPAQPVPMFDPKSLASWAAQRARAAAATQGANRMPGIFSNYAQIPQMNPMDVLRMLYPSAPDNAGIGLGGGVPFQRPAVAAPPAASAPVDNGSMLRKLLGIDSTPPATRNWDGGLVSLGPNQ